MSIPIPDRETAIALMRENNIKRIVLDFSGGNDEGGVENTTIEMKGNRNPVDLPDHWEYLDYGNRSDWFAKPRLKDDTPPLIQLRAALEAPIDEQYGSFAGDFYVSGTLTWDARSGKCVMEHDYETPSSEHYTTEF